MRARLEPFDQRQVLRPLLVRDLRRRSATCKPFPLVFCGAQRSAVLQRRRSTGTASSGRRSSTRCWSASATSRVTQETFDWAGIGAGNALYGIAGGQPIDGLSSIGWASGLTAPGAIATDSDTLAKTYQLNEKLTWLKGRHTLKFGGQLLHYNQRRFYAGNNGLLGFINFNGAFTGFAFSDFLLDLASSKGRGGGDPADPWTHLQNRTRCSCRTTSRSTPNLTLNLGLRWAYTSPLVEKDNRQSNFDLVTGQQIFAEDGSIEDRALYKPYYKGFEPRLGAAWRSATDWVVRGAYGISQFMEGTGANLRLPLNPPFFFESGVNYDATTGAGSAGSGFAGLVPGTTPTGNVRAYDPNLRPQFTHQWNAFVEYQVTSSHVGAGRLRRAPRRSPGHAGRRQPGAARRRRSLDLGGEDRRGGRSSARSRSSPRSPRPPRAAAAGTTRCRRACVSARRRASSSWRPTRWQKARRTTAASMACSAARVYRA